MPKLLILLTAFLIILIGTSPVYAEDASADIEINYGADNNAWATPGRKITITVKSVGGDSLFVPGAPYTYRFNNVAGKSIDCPKETIQAPMDAKQPIVIEKTIGNNDCSTQPGDWIFNLWAGDGGEPDGSNLIVSDYQFHLDQDGGGEPFLSSAYPEGVVPYNERPIITLVNAKKVNDYTFWWEEDEGLAGFFGETMASGVVKGSNLKGPPDATAFHLTLDKVNNKGGTTQKLCMEVGDLGAQRKDSLTCHYALSFIFGKNPPSKNPSCVISNPFPSTKDTIAMTVFNPSSPGNNTYTVRVNGPNISKESGSFTTGSPFLFDVTSQFRELGISPVEGKYTTAAVTNGNTICTAEFNARKPGSSNTSVVSSNNKALNCKGDECSQAAGARCDPVSGADSSDGGIKTALGCIPTSPALLTQSLLKFGAGIGGGLAFLMMIYASFLMITSAGNPDNLKKAHDQFINAVIGLLFIIFAVMLLKVIGVDILQIPGFQ